MDWWKTVGQGENALPGFSLCPTMFLPTGSLKLGYKDYELKYPIFVCTDS